MRSVLPEVRKRLDSLFMQVIASAQADIQASKPSDAGRLAVMFHREQVSDALQQLAALIAGWNNHSLDLRALEKANSVLRALGLLETAERIVRLQYIDRVDP
ncbi:MAG: hypothetical protein U0Z75_05780 [Deinococcaceae bacterium]